MGTERLFVQRADLCRFRLRVLNSCIMKSRFWIGEATVDKSVPIPLRWIIEILFAFPFMRKIMIPKDIGKRVLMHCAKEMNNLASFLPELYNLCQQNTCNEP